MCLAMAVPRQVRVGSVPRHGCQAAERASEAARRADAELAAVYAEKCVMVERCRAVSAERAAAGEQLLGASDQLRCLQRCGAMSTRQSPGVD